MASLMPIRELLRRMTLASRAELGEGRPDRAFSIGLDQLEIAEKVSRHGSSIDNSLGRTGGNFLVTTGERCIPKLTADAAHRLRVRFDALLARYPDYHSLLLDMRIGELQLVRGQLRDPDQLETLVAHAFDIEARDDAPFLDRAKRAVLRVFYPKPRVMGAVASYWNALTEAALSPYPVRTQAALPTDPVAAQLVGSLLAMDARGINYDAAKTKLLLLRLELALHEYRLATGSYPENLQQLVPQFVAGLALDPFSDRPFLYRRTDERYTLYSVGPDGVDDKGRAVSPWMVAADFENGERGDLVAGSLGIRGWY